MKYVLVDRYLDLVPGERATAVKNVPIGEGYFPMTCLEPAYAPSLLMESMAQTAGMLVAATFRFARKTVLAKIQEAEFPHPVRPGDHVEMLAAFLETLGGHCRMQVTASVEGHTVGRMVGLFTALELTREEGAPFDTPEFDRARASSLRCLGVKELLDRVPTAAAGPSEGEG
ncbi:MAG: hypothetical protein HY814_14620 [Candidatus Riflebacteria bacterium]|nr:hypothetical protein [Candidatus Riflebacteria bacterium]